MAFTEPEVYKEDEVFDESSDEEGDLLIKSAFEDEEVEEGVNEKENIKVKLEGTTKSQNIAIKTQDLDSLQEKIEKEAEDSKEDIFNASHRKASHPAPDISSKDCSTSLQPPFMQIFSPSRQRVGYPFLFAPANPSMYGMNVS